MDDYKFTVFQKIKNITIILGFDDAFSIEAGLERVGIAGPSAFSRRWAPLQKQKTKRTGGGSPVASPMLKLVHSGGREDQLLRE